MAVGQSTTLVPPAPGISVQLAFASQIKLVTVSVTVPLPQST
jgi:hypothetical protein